jgi:predicted small lipoprotein YifL
MNLKPILPLILFGLLTACGFKADLTLPGESQKKVQQQDDEQIKKNSKKDDTSR